MSKDHIKINVVGTNAEPFLDEIQKRFFQHGAKHITAEYLRPMKVFAAAAEGKVNTSDIMILLGGLNTNYTQNCIKHIKAGRYGGQLIVVHSSQPDGCPPTPKDLKALLYAGADKAFTSDKFYRWLQKEIIDTPLKPRTYEHIEKKIYSIRTAYFCFGSK